MPGPPKKKQRRSEHRNTDEAELPQKKYYRQRAHANPFSDHDLVYPEFPAAMDWTIHYPAFTTTDASLESKEHAEPTKPLSVMTKQVEVADIGCGFGGLLFALSPRMPETLILGMEIRTSVTEFVQQKAKALRAQHSSEAQSAAETIEDPPAAVATIPVQDSALTSQSQSTGASPYQNASSIRANTMKFLPNFFTRAQLSKIFLCFPDPHFKARKHKARIVSLSLNSEYAFVLRPGGKVYTITDVEDLHLWMVQHFAAHLSFERVGEEELGEDECVAVMKTETEEGKKVSRNGGKKFVAVFRRLVDPDWP